MDPHMGDYDRDGDAHPADHPLPDWVMLTAAGVLFALSVWFLLAVTKP